MLKRIIRKRTRQELADWEKVRHLMPRGNRTRGLQYETLEFLFSRLYENVSEEEVAEHLLAVRGQLQSTGDPVKGAINQAVKELQRLPDRLFSIMKIQCPGPGKRERFVKLDYARFQEVVGFQLYHEYLNDILADEPHLVLRCVANHDPTRPAEVFPGLRPDMLSGAVLEAINDYPPQSASRADVRLLAMPSSPANTCFLLIYEDAEAPDPFLGFLTDITPGEALEDAHFILYRGEEKFHKLHFLSRLWRRIAGQCAGVATGGK
ncbi:MAG: hypothetical protein QNK37_36305 [Acidobacteriota bacterium]|nr:hypothetical protein [Acidobacteriota bacterium]